MKYSLPLLLLFFCHTVSAQIPPKSGTPGDRYGGTDVPILLEESKSANENAGYYQKDGMYGFVYPERVRQEAVYNMINFVSNGFIVKKGELYGITDKKGKLLGNLEYDSVGAVYETAYIVKKKNKYGTISTEGNQILSIKYDKILAANSSVSFVRSANNQTQMIFNEQEKAFSSPIEYAALYANLTVIKAQGKFGVVKKQLVMPPTYDSIFVSGAQTGGNNTSSRQTARKNSPIDKSNSFKTVKVLTLQNNNRYGLADSDGAIIYSADNDAVSNQEMYKYCTVKKDNLHGIYFINSRKKTAIEFDRVYADGVGYVMANKNQKGGVFDLEGAQIVPFDYDPDMIMQYRNGFRIKKNKKMGIVSKEGKLLVPPLYDDVDPFYENGLEGLVKVKAVGKFGVLNMKGEKIIPLAFEWIGEEKGLLKVVTPDKRFGLYDKTGRVIIPAEYQWIIDSDTENSNLIVLEKQDKTYNFLNKTTNQVLLKETVSDYGYVPDQDGLLNPFASGDKHLLVIKDKNRRSGLLNENSGQLDVPIIYDAIMQRVDAGTHVYFSVKKGSKYGLIDEKNRPIIPLLYDAISIDLMSPDANSVIVKKGTKSGTLTLGNKIQIPFQYDGLQRISHTGLYKAKIGDNYKVINGKNEVINTGPFDEVANFEGSYDSGYQALTFYKGKMKVIDEKGRFKTASITMQPHRGYKTFDELKWALISALDSKDESLLKDFAARIAPSAHLLYYLKENIFTDQPLQYTEVDAIREKYYNDLLEFKLSHWNRSSEFSYNRTSLTGVKDYTLYRQGLVTNTRAKDPAFGDSRFMERILRNAIKINGYWISSYFMQRNFDHF